MKISLKNNKFKFVTVPPALWDDESVEENAKDSLFGCWSIPLKPRIHPVKLFVVIPVYVIISSSILNRPYFCGNPIVWLT